MLWRQHKKLTKRNKHDKKSVANKEKTASANEMYWVKWICRQLLSGLNRFVCHFIPVSTWKKVLARVLYGQKLDLNHPKKLNEKILWLEYHTDSSLRSRLTDKYEVRSYVKEKGYGNALIPVLGLYRHADEINLLTLPERFVLKATHGCDMNYICRDKTQLDNRELARRMNLWLHTNIAYISLETHYLSIKPRILCEQYLDSDEDELIDYKVHCSNGRARFILVCRTEGNVRYRSVYDRKWKRLDVIRNAAPDPKSIPKPEKFEEMIQMAETLAENIPFVRIDLYLTKGKIYFGEMTFTPATGLLFHFTEEFLLQEGRYCILPQPKQNKKRIRRKRP